MTVVDIPETVALALVKITADAPLDQKNDPELLDLLLENFNLPSPRLKVGGYVRLSEYRGAVEDDSDIAVVRQAKDVLEHCTEDNICVSHWFVDNGISASNKWIKRPDYESMFSKLQSGSLDGIIFYDIERLYRQPRQLEDLIDLVEKQNTYVSAISEVFDLTTGSGKANARGQVTGGAKYSDDISRRQKRKVRSRVAKGAWHGGTIPFGYRPGAAKGSLEVNEAEKHTVRVAVDMILDGTPLSAVVRHLNEQGMLTRAGKPWQRSALRELLMRETLTGYRHHQPRIKNTTQPVPGTKPTIVKGKWDAIITDEEHAALRAILLSDSRRTTPVGGGHARKFLAVGYLQCGKCGAHLIGKTGQSRGIPYHYYICTGAGCYVRRNAVPVDDFIAGAVLTRLADVDQEIGTINDPAIAKLKLELLQISEREEEMHAANAAGDIAVSDWTRGMKHLNARKKAVEAQIKELSNPKRLVRRRDENALKLAWQKGSLAQKRDYIAQAGLVFRVDPVGRGRFRALGVTALPVSEG
jgi:DNA invertase Pin-like site-specific DNA recombinase